MTISEIIEKLKEIQEEQGDVQVSCDFRSYDTKLEYDKDLNCIFGE